jgi:hypothetical protein
MTVMAGNVTLGKSSGFKRPNDTKPKAITPMNIIVKVTALFIDRSAIFIFPLPLYSD